MEKLKALILDGQVGAGGIPCIQPFDDGKCVSVRWRYIPWQGSLDTWEQEYGNPPEGLMESGM